LTLAVDFAFARSGEKESLLNQLDSHIGHLGWTKTPVKINFADVISARRTVAQKWYK
jgi:hypothetical protein